MNKIKILMTTMGLGLGGAETHIVELSKQLAHEGFTVCVSSNGGIYVEELTKHGIAHYNAPMHRRSIFAMAVSFFKLLYVIIKEKPDIVHSHARIPAFLSSVACSLTGVPLITTVHFNFKTSGGLKFLTRWGKKSIAASDDLKKYLIQNYGIPEKDISVTVNGINTEVFSPSVSGESIRKEFGFTERNRLIVTVSRMDHNACFAAFELLKCADRLYADNADSRIVVVGSGDALSDIQDIAFSINDRLGCKFVTVTGGRTDIYAFCAAADIFVGVSRAALEAMAVGKPIVLAGNQGSLGLFTEELTEQAMLTNFTCRGLEPTTSDMIYKDITRFFSLPEETRRVICSYGRKLVCEHYSVRRMTSDAVTVYNEVLQRKKFDILLCGYYGYHNAGDEALLKSIVSSLHAQRPDLKIAVLVKSRSALDKSLPITPIGRFNPITLLYAVSNSSMLIFGGGNIIQDSTSTKSLLYYLFIIRLGLFYGLKTMLYANGIGPIMKKSNVRRVAKVLNEVDVITLRESVSYDLLRSIGVTRPDISITADEVFTAVSGTFSAGVPKINLPKEKYAVISLRPWKTNDPKFEPKLAEYLDSLVDRYGVELVFLPMQEVDVALCSRLRSMLRSKSSIYTYLSIDELLYVISRSVLVVGMRLHSLIFATGCCVPSIGIVYDPKVDGFLNYIGIKDFVYCDNISVSKLNTFSAAIFENHDKITAKLQEASDILIKTAQRNAIKAIELLDSGKIG